MKLFRLVKSTNDTYFLQDDFIILANWCAINKLLLNLDECKIMTFTWSRNSVHHIYNIHNHPLIRVNEFYDFTSYSNQIYPLISTSNILSINLLRY